MKDNRFYLEHIKEAILKIDDYTQGGRETFMSTPLIQDGVIRQFEIIGEAAKRLTSDIRDKHPQIPWSAIGKFRDVLIHHYFGISVEQVWSTIEQDLAELKLVIEQEI